MAVDRTALSAGVLGESALKAPAASAELESGRESARGLGGIHWRPWETAAVGIVGAGAVGLVTFKNPSAVPTHAAVALRVGLILSFAGAAVYAQRNELHERMGQVLAAATAFSSLWLLNGAAGRAPTGIGELLSGVAPVVLAAVMLAHPTGVIKSRVDRSFLLIVGGGLIVGWTAGLLLTGQPVLHAPLVHCGARCPANALSLGLTTDVPAALKLVVAGLWITLPVGTAVLVHRRARNAPLARRRCLTPVWAAAIVQSILLVAYLAVRVSGTASADAVGSVYAAAALIVPLAVFVGLAREQLFMGDALAELVADLAEFPRRDPQAFIAATLQDPSLQIAYRRSTGVGYVNAAGVSVDLEAATEDRSINWVRRDGEPIAAVLYAPELADEEAFIHAIGAAALIRLEKAQLQAELEASTRELEQSRVRLVETAHAERRRIERDLHDSVQQHLVGLRIKLDLAVETMHDDPETGERQLASVGRQLDEVLQTLRALARGIYPNVLHERGLPEAIKSVARSSPMPVRVQATHFGRFPEDIEVAIYFCCLEALQNVAKHGGADVNAIVSLTERRGEVTFEVRDNGPGFDLEAVRAGSGLVNMRDRIEAVGGRLRISSVPGRGTVVRAIVPLA